jgi:hypothetical protein
MGFLPNIIYYALLILISLIAGILFWFRVWSIWSRDRMNYQAYDWKFNPSNLPTSGTSTLDPWTSSTGSLGTCIGNACCSDGLVYDDTINQCVVPPQSATTTTSITQSLTSKMPSISKPNVVLGGDSVQPSYGSSFINYSNF